MVFYFSGTGNSQLVARQIGKITADEVVSINYYLKSGKKASFQSNRPLVFAAPTYCWQIPKVVEQWILETSFQGNQNAYFILTCAGSCGNAEAYVKKLCGKKNLRFCGLAPVIMPENYVAMFPTPKEGESKEIIKNAGARIAEIGEIIKAGQCFEKTEVSFDGKLKSGPVNQLFYTVFVHDKGFTASDKCISCGKCALRCPLNNIDIINGKPKWKGDCTHCMACIGGCPTEAIEYKGKSKGQRRHYIMDDALCWNRGGQER